MQRGLDPITNLARRGRQFKLSRRQYAQWKAQQIQYFSDRWQHLPPGLDRQVQAEALLCILEDRPVDFDIRTHWEAMQSMKDNIERARAILRERKRKA